MKLAFLRFTAIMKGIIHIMIFLTSIVGLIVGSSMASRYIFDSKVAPQENDLCRLLKIMTYCTIDTEDVVYPDTPLIGIVIANEIRLISFDCHPARIKFKPYDKKMNAPLKPLIAEIRFLNLNESQSFEFNDQIYIHQSNDLTLNDTIDASKNASQMISSSFPNNPLIGYYEISSNIENISNNKNYIETKNLTNHNQESPMSSVYTMDVTRPYSYSKENSEREGNGNPIANVPGLRDIY